MNLQRVQKTELCKRREEHLYKQFVNHASQSLSFSEEVTKELANMSFKNFDFSRLFLLTGPLAPSTKMQRKKKIHHKINPSTQNHEEVSEQAAEIISNTSSNSLCNQSKINDEMKKRNPFIKIELKRDGTEDLKDQRRNKQRSNIQSQLTVNPIEIPHAPRLQDILNSQDTCHVMEKTFTGRSRALKDERPGTIKPLSMGSLKHIELKAEDSEKQKLPVAELTTLCFAIDKWRSACNVKIPVKSVTIDDLKQALTDQNCQVRMEAIITCASGIVYGLQEELDIDKAAQHAKALKLKAVPHKLQVLIASALDDPVKRVQMAAAVCLYAMTLPNACARDILRSTITQDKAGTGADSLVAAQCLAIQGDASQSVIQRLLSQHFLGKSSSDQEQALKLLSMISSKTTLVRSLLAEELNNANWNTRVQACNSLTQLQSPVNKDVCNKLIHLMWTDWSRAVRHAAALALNELDTTREMHSELSTKLKEGPSVCRLEALTFIGQLKIMTPKLLPTFLQCFTDDCEAVRRQACRIAHSLMISDQQVLDQLVNLMQNEPLWEVKAEAIKALGKLGWRMPAFQELLIWALHQEQEPRVRIAACEALSTSDTKSPELENLLQERYALEPNEDVQRQIEGLLKKHGYSLNRDQSQLHEIKLQVKLLSTKQIVTRKVLSMDEVENSRQQKQF